MKNRQIEFAIRNAGIENLIAFAENVNMMLQQELDALRACAGEGDIMRCAKCLKVIKRAKCDLVLSHTSEIPHYYIAFECEHCDALLAVDVKPVESIVKDIPF